MASVAKRGVPCVWQFHEFRYHAAKVLNLPNASDSAPLSKSKLIIVINPYQLFDTAQIK
jgi:hypothetical protein